METIFNALGGRKFSLAMVVLGIGTVAFFIGKLSETGWLDLVKWDLITYLGAAVGSDVADRFGKPIPVAAQLEPPAP